MFGTEPTRTWWRRPVLLAAAGGVVAGVVIGGASHSLPASSTQPIGRPAATARLTVTAAAPTVTLTHTSTVTVVITATNQPTSAATGPAVDSQPAAKPSSGRPGTPASSVPASSVPAGAGPIALCKDGTFSYASQHQGACSHHHGVAHWYR